MRLLHHADELRDFQGGSLVPTMGALHAGHQSLIRAARRSADDAGGKRRSVVVSIFVNPTQFAPHEDFSRYPRDLEGDLALAEAAGADLVFAPSVEVMYPRGVTITAPPLPSVATMPELEDHFRPTHFAGVCQVVARLFDLVQPAQAFFGRKDYQQWRVIDALVQEMGEREPQRWGDLHIIPCPIVRDADGLALSSRNRALSSDQRNRALGLVHALSAGCGENLPRSAEGVMHSVLAEHDLTVDYAVVRDPESLMPIADFARPAVALIAARCDDVRLIDNCDLPPQ